MKLSEAFEGESSSLRKAFDNATMTSHNEAQKTKADWLRSEIEKLELMLELTTDKDSDNAWAFKVHKNKTLTTIITRYKEELKVLESK